MAKKEVVVTKVTAEEKEAQVMSKEIVPIAAKAVLMKIASADHMVQASEVLSRLNKYADTVKKAREAKTKPLMEHLKWVRSLFSPIEDKLEEAIGSVRREMTDYQTKQTAIADKQANDIASRVGEGKGKIKAETAVKKMSEIDVPVKSIGTDSGTVKFKPVPKFEVVDLTKLPVDYILPNEVAIRKAMLAKIELPGVRYYTEQVPVNFR